MKAERVPSKLVSEDLEEAQEEVVEEKAERVPSKLIGKDHKRNKMKRWLKAKPKVYPLSLREEPSGACPRKVPSTDGANLQVQRSARER
jgi:hypothetical protein